MYYITLVFNVLNIHYVPDSALASWMKVNRHNMLVTKGFPTIDAAVAFIDKLAPVVKEIADATRNF